MMPSSNLISALLKSAEVGFARNARNPVSLLVASVRCIHKSSGKKAPASESMNEGANQKAKDVAAGISGKAKDMSEKAKQTAGETLVSTKEAAQRAKEMVENRTEVSKEYVKEHADQVKKSMNTKKE